MNCSHCENKNIQSRGIKNGIHSFYCTKCNDWTRIRETKYNVPSNLPVIAVCDIEYLPMNLLCI